MGSAPSPLPSSEAASNNKRFKFEKDYERSSLLAKLDDELVVLAELLVEPELLRRDRAPVERYPQHKIALPIEIRTLLHVGTGIRREKSDREVTPGRLGFSIWSTAYSTTARTIPISLSLT